MRKLLGFLGGVLLIAGCKGPEIESLPLDDNTGLTCLWFSQETTEAGCWKQPCVCDGEDADCLDAPDLATCCFNDEDETSKIIHVGVCLAGHCAANSCVEL